VVNYKSFPVPISQMPPATSNRRIYLGTIARDSLTAPKHRGDFSEDPIVLSWTPGKTRSSTINLVQEIKARTGILILFRTLFRLNSIFFELISSPHYARFAEEMPRYICCDSRLFDELRDLL